MEAAAAVNVPPTDRLVYGLVWSTDSDRASRLGQALDPSLDVVSEGDLSALVTARDAGPANPGELRSYFAVLEAVAGEVDVLPMRFGVTVPEGVLRREVLAPQASRFRATLDSVRGQVELRLRYFYRRDSILAQIVRRNPTIRRLKDLSADTSTEASMPLKFRLGELVAAALERNRRADAAWLFERLRGGVERIRTSPPAGEMGVLTASTLVDRPRAAAVRQTAADLAEESPAPLAVRVLGPLPPWSFVQSPQAGAGR